MGLIAKSAKKIAEQHKGFEPIELNCGNVQAIFNRCLAKNGEPFHNVQVLGPETVKNPSDIFQLSTQKIKENEQCIQYLIGQLKTIHLPKVKSIVLQEGFFRYDNSIWTKDFNELFKLYSLGLAGKCIRGFGKTNNDTIGSMFYSDRCIPTLSPKDPKFQAWWAQHKSEWETPKKDGQEPGDM